MARASRDSSPARPSSAPPSFTPGAPTPEAFDPGSLRRLLPWLAVAAVSIAVVAWAFRPAHPLFPADWTVTAGEAEDLVVERLRELGEAVERPLVTTDQITDPLLELRLLRALEEDDGLDAESLRDSLLGRRIAGWRVSVYPPGAQVGRWAYRGSIGFDGRLRSLLRRVEPDEAADPIEPDRAIARADTFLAGLGVDLDAFERPGVRSRDMEARTDLELRYVAREALLGPDTPYGLEVRFAGDRLVGFESFLDDPREQEAQRTVQALGLWNQLHFVGTFVLVLLVALPFLRRYHDGEIGVRRSVKIFLVFFVSSAGLLLLISEANSEGVGWNLITRGQAVFIFLLQNLLLFFLPLALLAALSWSVGESLVRENKSRKLAAFDALLTGHWSNATVARSCLRGVAAGLAILAVYLVALLGLRGLGIESPSALLVSGFWAVGALPGLHLLVIASVIAISRELFGRLFLVPLSERLLGGVGLTWLGPVLAAVVAGLVTFPAFIVLPLSWGIAVAVGFAALLVILFVTFDLLTVLLASLVAESGLAAVALIHSQDPGLTFQGWAVFAVLALPIALTVRGLTSRREFVYRWDDVPPHVRRIAERERQRVELETARGIQSAILPKLPPRLHGVEMAHAYRPATEVGGDFYDVLALEDGRLAVAVGDVAGHGVSSGLVMAGAKSALAVQVTFDPSVEAVFTTLNRMVYQSARKRLIATLCYALIDPRERDMVFASAGHLYPYVLTASGQVRSLASTAYPLGVRPKLEIRVNRVGLDAGDTLLLLSDGIVEARPEGSDELFGFERLERSLEQRTGASVEAIRDGILDDLEHYVGPSPREDDQTLLVLRIP